MEISCTDHVRNEVLHGVKEERNILHTMKISKVKWNGQILRGNYLLKHVIQRDRRKDCSEKMRMKT